MADAAALGEDGATGAATAHRTSGGHGITRVTVTSEASATGDAVRSPIAETGITAIGGTSGTQVIGATTGTATRTDPTGDGPVSATAGSVSTALVAGPGASLGADAGVRVSAALSSLAD